MVCAEESLAHRSLEGEMRLHLASSIRFAVDVCNVCSLKNGVIGDVRLKRCGARSAAKSWSEVRLEFASPPPW
jgi:hypothetical protein